VFLSLGIALRDELVPWAVYTSIFGFATLLCLFWIHEVFLVRVSFSEEGIDREGGLVYAIHLPWHSITGVSFAESSGSICPSGGSEDPGQRLSQRPRDARRLRRPSDSRRTRRPVPPLAPEESLQPLRPAGSLRRSRRARYIENTSLSVRSWIE